MSRADRLIRAWILVLLVWMAVGLIWLAVTRPTTTQNPPCIDNALPVYCDK